MHIAAAMEINSRLISKSKQLQTSLHSKSIEFKDIIKIGRSHTQDETPFTLETPYSGHEIQRLKLNKVQQNSLFQSQMSPSF